MKWRLGGLIGNRIVSFLKEIIKPDKNRNKITYRGATCDRSDIKARTQGNNRMSYRGVSYQLVNSKIRK